jgi:hypothetical protein
MSDDPADGNCRGANTRLTEVGNGPFTSTYGIRIMPLVE